MPLQLYNFQLQTLGLIVYLYALEMTRDYIFTYLFWISLEEHVIKGNQSVATNVLNVRKQTKGEY